MFLSISFHLLIDNVALAQEKDSIKIIYSGYKDSIIFTQPLHFYVETGSPMTIDEVRHKHFTTDISEVRKEHKNSQLRAVWMKGMIVNKTDTPLTVLLNLTNMVHFDLYGLSDGEFNAIIKGGYGYKLPEKKVTDHYLPFPYFKINSHDTVHYYARIISESPGLGSELIVYSPASADMEADEVQLHYRGLYHFRYAFLAIMIFQLVYISIQWIVKRRKEYGFYTVYLLSCVVFFWMRIEYIYRDYFFWAFKLEHILPTITAVNFMCFLFYFGFGRNFLDLKLHLPKLNRSVIITEISLSIFILFIFAAPYFGIMINSTTALWVGGILLFVVSLTFIISALKIGNVTAYYFLAGTTIYATSSLVSFMIRNLGWISISNTFDNIIFLECGMIAEMLFFTSGLAHKEILIQKEKTIVEQQLKLEKQSKDLEKKLALKEERDRISRELHDDLGAQLSTAKMFLNSIIDKETITEHKNLVETSLNLIDGSIKDLRKIMDELHDSTLQEKGYLIATEELVNRINELQQMHFTLSHTGMEKRMDPKLEHNLFRITQELINNSLKYAKASRVTLDVIGRNGIGILMYEDNGTGFDLDHKKTGYGLKNIESRTVSMGGKIFWDTSRGNGFRCTVEFPIMPTSS